MRRGRRRGPARRGPARGRRQRQRQRQHELGLEVGMSRAIPPSGPGVRAALLVGAGAAAGAALRGPQGPRSPLGGQPAAVTSGERSREAR